MTFFQILASILLLTRKTVSDGLTFLRKTLFSQYPSNWQSTLIYYLYPSTLVQIVVPPTKIVLHFPLMSLSSTWHWSFTMDRLGGIWLSENATAFHAKWIKKMILFQISISKFRHQSTPKKQKNRRTYKMILEQSAVAILLVKKY